MLGVANYNKSKNAADTLIVKMGIKDAPVQVFDIAKEMNLTVMEYNLGTDTSGVLVINNGKGTIGYNPRDSFVRKRFTVAHELGHYLLHRQSNSLFVDRYFLMKYRGNNSYTAEEYIQEQEANTFAATLLMPEKFIEKFLRSDELKDLGESDIINKLAAKFEVSISAMTFRLTNLNIFT